MPARSRRTLRALVRTALSLTLPLLALAASDADAQRNASAASGGAEDYRLTMPVLRKALPALYAPGADAECAQKGEDYRDVRAMGVAEMEQHLNTCAPVKRAAAAQGIAIRELALVSKAIVQASYRMAEEESAKVSGGSAAPLPAGVLRDNVALLRQHESELSRLSPRSK